MTPAMFAQLKSAPLAAPSTAPERRRVLNVGCGPRSMRTLPQAFREDSWEEVRLDIDPDVEPDLVGSIVDMQGLVRDASYDAIWSSHNLEHLHAHQVLPALLEFKRVLKPDGLALVNCPDLEIAARLIVEGRIDEAAYVSRAGPVTALDMMFGHSRSIERGKVHMADGTGFTLDLLGRLLIEAGFAEARVAKGTGYDLWALALMPEAHPDEVGDVLRRTNLAILES